MTEAVAEFVLINIRSLVFYFSFFIIFFGRKGVGAMQSPFFYGSVTSEIFSEIFSALQNTSLFNQLAQEYPDVIGF